MDLASGKIELSERYIQKLKCGHTLQSYNAVVLWRNNGIGTPSVTAATVLEHSRVVSSTWKNVRAVDCVSCSKIFLHAGSNPVVLKNSTEHPETLAAVTPGVLIPLFLYKTTAL